MNLEKTVAEINREVKIVKKLLIGNGDVGLCERVRDHEKRIECVEKKPFRMKEWLVFMITAGTFLILIYQVIKK